jgi:hypothetical protein
MLTGLNAIFDMCLVFVSFVHLEVTILLVLMLNTQGVN